MLIWLRWWFFLKCGNFSMNDLYCARSMNLHKSVEFLKVVFIISALLFRINKCRKIKNGLRKKQFLKSFFLSFQQVSIMYPCWAIHQWFDVYFNSKHYSYTTTPCYIKLNLWNHYHCTALNIINLFILLLNLMYN